MLMHGKPCLIPIIKHCWFPVNRCIQVIERKKKIWILHIKVSAKRWQAVLKSLNLQTLFMFALGNQYKIGFPCSLMLCVSLTQITGNSLSVCGIGQLHIKVSYFTGVKMLHVSYLEFYLDPDVLVRLFNSLLKYSVVSCICTFASFPWFSRYLLFSVIISLS